LQLHLSTILLDNSIDLLVILDESADFFFVWDGSGITGKFKLRGGGVGGPFNSGFGFILLMNRLMEDTTWLNISWNSSLVARISSNSAGLSNTSSRSWFALSARPSNIFSMVSSFVSKKNLSCFF
jgi:hypothetical protein